MGYASIARGLQPSDVIQAHGEISSFDSEKTKNLEVGLKSNFLEHRIRLNVAAFYTDYDNRLFSSIDGATLQEVTRVRRSVDPISRLLPIICSAGRHAV